MVTAPLLQGVPRRTRQRRLPERGERRGLVHVVPETREPLREPLLVEAAPPLTHTRVREVGKHRLPGPHDSPHDLPRRVPHERVLGRPAVVHGIAGQGPDGRVDDRHQPDAVPPEFLGQNGQLREAVMVDGEHLMRVEVVDVQVHGIERQTVLHVARDDPPHLLLAAEPPPRVLMAECPGGRQRGRAGERGPGQQHAPGSARHHPAAQRTAVHPQLARPPAVVPGTRALLALPQRHRAVPRAVVEHQMRTAVGHHQLHRHRDVQGVVARREGVAGVGVPQPVRTVRQPRTRGTSTQAEEARVGSHLRPLQPPRRAATDRLPPPRRQITPQGHATGRKHLHRAVP